MSFVEKDGFGSLFKNEKTKDAQPDYKGTFTINGVQYGIAGWVKDGRNGKFMSLKVEEKKERDPGGQGAPAKAERAASGISPEEIPF